MSTEYDINYDDQRFLAVEAEKEAAISENEQLYSGMIKDSDGYYQAQIDASKEWEKKQTQLQQEKTDFAIEQIEQQKDQAKKDYIKEQSGAYADWQKQSNEYGANAEKEATMGMGNTGYSESMQVSMYNTYQNRYATAREAYSRAVLNYDNAIKDARLQNNSVLAEIAYKSLQQQLELSLQGFQYKNQLLKDKANQKIALDQMYHERWQDVLTQMNTENTLAEQVRQFNAEMALQQAQFDWQKEQASKKSSGGGGGGYRRSSSSSGDGATLEKDGGSEGDGVNIDTKSVLNLGKGPISGAELDRLEAAGEIYSTQKGNTISFHKNEPIGQTLGIPTLTSTGLGQSNTFKQAGKYWNRG